MGTLSILPVQVGIGPFAGNGKCPHFLARALAIAALACLAAGCPRETAIDLGRPEKVADGVQLYRLDDPNLLDPAAMTGQGRPS